MNINSTEDERYNEIKDKVFNVYAWDYNEEDNISLDNSNQKPIKKIKEYYEMKNIANTELFLEGCSFPLYLKKQALKESIHIMDGIHQSPELLLKAMTILPQITKEAKLIDVEKYRHNTREKSKNINCVCQYLSVFGDERKIYPVKLSLEINNSLKNSNIYLIITVGQINKEALGLRVHPTLVGESVEYEEPLYNVNIADIIKNFNAKQAIILKNLPNQLLSDEQKRIKERIKTYDNNKDKAIEQITNKINMLNNEKRQIKSLYYNNYQDDILNNSKENEEINKDELENDDYDDYDLDI